LLNYYFLIVVKYVTLMISVNVNPSELVSNS